MPGNSNSNIEESAFLARVEDREKIKEPLRPIAILADEPPVPATERLMRIPYRLAEIMLAATALIITLPLIVIVAVLIRLDSPGPVFFIMQRTGKSKRVRGRYLINDDSVRPPMSGFDPDKYYWVPRSFPFIKFRTMYVDAAKRYPEYYWWNYNLSNEEVRSMFYKVQDDPRLTRIGKWLRKTSLDEIPNFLHVLTGEAGIVGPRPEGKEIQRFYTEEQMKKFTIKPGLTCSSKINGRGDLNVGEQIEWDLEYVKNRNVWLDITIVFKTIWLVLTQRGAF